MKIPKHLAVIPDGNRRWAREKGLPAFEGHRRGFDAALKIVKAARKLGIHTFTLWAFSTENWQRSEEEVNFLMKLYQVMIAKFLPEAKKEKVKIIHLGRKDRIPASLRKKIEKAEEETKDNKKYILNIALDYGGRDEILRAAKKAQDLTEEGFSQYLDTANQPYPEPDLIIRTSGEQRMSGFLLWQSAYSEFYFESCYFPDFTPEKLKKAIKEYSQRQRRFGK